MSVPRDSLRLLHAVKISSLPHFLHFFLTPPLSFSSPPGVTGERGLRGEAGHTGKMGPMGGKGMMTKESHLIGVESSFAPYMNFNANNADSFCLWLNLGDTFISISIFRFSWLPYLG